MSRQLEEDPVNEAADYRMDLKKSEAGSISPSQQSKLHETEDVPDQKEEPKSPIVDRPQFGFSPPSNNEQMSKHSCDAVQSSKKSVASDQSMRSVSKHSQQS